MGLSNTSRWLLMAIKWKLKSTRSLDILVTLVLFSRLMDKYNNGLPLKERCMGKRSLSLATWMEYTLSTLPSMELKLLLVVKEWKSRAPNTSSEIEYLVSVEILTANGLLISSLPD